MQTFIVRLWVPSNLTPETDETLRGVVEQLGSGLSTPFADDDELLAILRQAEREPTAARQAGGTS